MTHLTEDPAVRRQIRDIIKALRLRLEIAGYGLEDWNGWTADDLATALGGGTARAGNDILRASDAAAVILHGLLDPDVAQSSEFWGSPLGRAVAFSGDGVPASVTWSCAAAALGCTRANVSLMVGKGELSEPVNAVNPRRITTASLAHAMRSRYPLGA